MAAGRGATRASPPRLTWRVRLHRVAGRGVGGWLHRHQVPATPPEGSPDDAVEAMTITWAGDFASPEKVLPMPPFRISSLCNDATFESIFEHFHAETLVRRLGDVHLPSVFVLGADSPLRPR